MVPQISKLCAVSPLDVAIPIDIDRSPLSIFNVIFNVFKFLSFPVSILAMAADWLIKLLKKVGFVVLFWLRYARHARHYFTFWVCQCMFYLGNTNKKSNSRPIFFQTARKMAS